MAPASTATREAPASSNDRMHAPAPRPANNAIRGATHNTGRPIPARPSRTATDDEILGLDPASTAKNGSVGALQVGLPGRRLVEPGRSGVPPADPWRDAAHPPSTTAAAESDDPWREVAAAHTSSPSSPRIACMILMQRGNPPSPKPCGPRSTPTPNSAARGTTRKPTANPSHRPTTLATRPHSSPTSTAWTRSSSRAARKTTPSSPAPSPASILQRLPRSRKQ
jgi:hypothetical protein